jgi:transglutaminase-like putative cysteine protease
MPKVQVVHTTEYRYNNPVTLSAHRLMLRPRDSHDLRLIDATLGLTPPAASVRWAHDVFGNSVAFIDFGDKKADQLKIVSTLELEHFPIRTDLPPDPLAETYPFQYDPEELPDLAPLILRYSPDPKGEVKAWAMRFLNPSGPTRTVDMLTTMTQAIKADFLYQAREVEGTQLPSETLAAGSGTCRDFALLMIEAARSLGLAARFISGYLYDESLVDSPDPVVGGGATHAWCAVYLPGAGWVEFDPTNGLIAGRNLIRVAVARTPQQALPITGGFVGASNDFAGLTVNVEVAVGDKPEPFADTPPTQSQVQTAVEAEAPAPAPAQA